MSWMKWLPWRLIIRYVARKQGFLDPIALLARLHSFAQPSEVAEPVELLRAGVIFHARGLINSRVIQHNLDWVWPYWIERQFDPTDLSFIPRAFSFTHINLSHRNWTAIGYPECAELPIVDPRGLLTPLLDGWSLDAWLMTEDGRSLLPSRAPDCRQQQEMESGLCITTDTQMNGLTLTSRAWVQIESGIPVCKLRLQARADSPASLVLALRPYNPEGISFINKVSLSPTRDTWTIDDKQQVSFSTPAAQHHVADYHSGDVFIHLRDREVQTEGHCEVGMVTAAALFPCNAGETTDITASIPLASKPDERLVDEAWHDVHQEHCQLSCPEARYQFLYDAAIASLILHSPGDVYPGPYTYKRFWFRDAAFIIHALLCAGLTHRAERALARFPARQTGQGYFRSQEGEWDSNGQVLWILQRFFALTNRQPSLDWHDPVARGGRWILRKRVNDASASPHAGLLPAGFSAEHLGPNDYYYWDDFWGIAGLHAAAAMFAEMDPERSRNFATGADNFAAAVDHSLVTCAQRLDRAAMPASPYRRLDAGAIGSLAAGYPLQLCAPDDPRLLDTVEFLYHHCFVKGTFYQDMTHSGLNAYLTLHIAQVMLRAGDPRYLELMDAVADLASPTGQWPEACHPLTGGGCMGDGHHVWASAEWLLMIRNCFVREEAERLILVSGIPERWLEQTTPIHFGPAPTRFGTVSITLTPDPGNAPRIDWQGDWHEEVPPIEIRLPGYVPLETTSGSGCEVLVKKET
ncbi:MAG: hypothetical protein RI563_11170 [Thiohalophilus sp.]|uniref:hypothetical protein n=1 Tax=Thiohalophilus sp. TaxID=3028392 RepID=UPI00286FD681|nr:hypothetical protein [Thiohalophilus sp.]MDR9437437.1 hypothetical protein [Thiohalophilus sp.]